MYKEQSVPVLLFVVYFRFSSGIEIDMGNVKNILLPRKGKFRVLLTTFKT